MKIKVKITEIDHEDLVDLFSTALYGSTMFSAIYDSIEYQNLPDKSDTDCFEDKIAKLLLAGKTVEVADQYAECDEDFYGSLPHTWDKEHGLMLYTVSLADIRKGIERCFNYNKSKSTWLNRCAFDFLYCSEGNFDLPEAESIMQVIIFGEEIYG